MGLHSTIRKILKEETQEKKILKLPSLDFFDKDPEVAWNIIQKIVEAKSNPPYSIDGDLDLRGIEIESLGNLVSVEGTVNLDNIFELISLGELKLVKEHLVLGRTSIEKFEKLESVGWNLTLEKSYIKSLGSLVYVGGSIFANKSDLESLGNLKFVGGYLSVKNTPLSKIFTEEQIREKVEVNGKIYL